MICECCKKDLDEKDFFKDKKECYRCIFERKSKCKIKKLNLCKVCKNIIDLPKTTYGRPRSIYCSKECAKIGHVEQNNNYWTIKLKKTIPLI